MPEDSHKTELPLDRTRGAAAKTHMLRRLAIGGVVIGTAIVAVLASSRLAGTKSVPPSSDETGFQPPGALIVAPEERSATDPLAITTYNAIAAQVASDTIGIFAFPESLTPTSVLSRTNEHGVPQTFLVLEVRKGWARVMLPGPPNGSTGWIRTSEVNFYGVEHVVRVRLASKRLEVWERGRLAFSFPAGIGRKNTPTPGGRYYIKELLQPTDPAGPWGSYAFGLNGYSNSVYGPDGEPQVIGIHGTNEPDSVGKEVSAGCVRLRNEDIEKLVGLLPLGTPVEIMED